MNITTIIGVDVATAANNTALARAELHQTNGHCELRICELRNGSRQYPPADIANDWLAEAPATVLLAMDAPLGWPAPMTTALADHRAGEPLPHTPNQLFRRTTDQFIHQHLGKLPLDVGADRIARTAFAALTLLEELRQRRQTTIEVAATPIGAGIRAIEVYPGGLLQALGMRSSGYKRPTDVPLRRELLKQLVAQLGYPLAIPDACAELAGTSDHAFDAILAAVAGADFLADLAMPPDDPALARREGWIWSRPTNG